MLVAVDGRGRTPGGTAEETDEMSFVNRVIHCKNLEERQTHAFDLHQVGLRHRLLRNRAGVVVLKVLCDKSLFKDMARGSTHNWHSGFLL